MYGECLEGVLKCLEGVWICLEGVCNVPEGVWKVSKGFLNIFPFDVVRCPRPNCPPMNKVCAVSPLPVYIFSVLCTPPCSSVLLPHLAQFWILSEVENLVSSSLQD